VIVALIDHQGKFWRRPLGTGRPAGATSWATAALPALRCRFRIDRRKADGDDARAVGRRSASRPAVVLPPATDLLGTEPSANRVNVHLPAISGGAPAAAHTRACADLRSGARRGSAARRHRRAALRATVPDGDASQRVERLANEGSRSCRH
jgi:hypothetical protein